MTRDTGKLLHENCVNPSGRGFSFEVSTSRIALFSFSENLQDVGSERQGLRSMLHMCQEMGGAQPCGEKSIVRSKKT